MACPTVLVGPRAPGRTIAQPPEPAAGPPVAHLPPTCPRPSQFACRRVGPFTVGRHDDSPTPFVTAKPWHAIVPGLAPDLAPGLAPTLGPPPWSKARSKPQSRLGPSARIHPRARR